MTVQREQELRIAQEMLSTKEQLYVDARVSGHPPEKSARIAGFDQPRKKSRELEQSEHIVFAIRATLRVLSARQAFTREDIAAGIMDGINVASTASEVIMGWREIGRLYGLYAPEKKEVTTRDEKIERLSDEELASMAAIEAEFEVLPDDS